MNRHVEALAEEFLGRGHDVRVLAPYDPPGRVSRLTHRAAPEPRELPDYLVPLGRTMGFGVNGSVGNLSPFPTSGVLAPRREVRRGEFDVIHVHEPLGAAGRLERDARRPLAGRRDLPRLLDQGRSPTTSATLTGARRMFNRLSARIAVSEAAAWTGRRWYGGDYTIIPNGVDVDAAPSASGIVGRRAADPLRRPARGAQGAADPADRLRRPGRARSLPADRDRRRARGRAPLHGRPRADATRSTSSAASPASGSGRSCTAPTCSAPPRSPARASGWC